MYVLIKRFLDIILSIIILPILLPILLLSYLYIKYEDGGPLFYMAERTGQFGQTFKMFKLRSMKVNAPDIRMADDSTYNSADDQRVTQFGKFARKTSIDELPQLLNVLKGDMSLVGPRPNSVSYINRYTKEERVSLNVKPGITGYNQVENRNNVGTKEKLKNDVYYVNHLSFILDLMIIIKTIKMVLKQKNLYRN